MPHDSSATKTRILAAALGEFSAFGLAGARVDRIAEVGQVNKRILEVAGSGLIGLSDQFAAGAYPEPPEHLGEMHLDCPRRDAEDG